jgi:hypothetical protein
LSELPSNLNVIINNERTRTSKFSLAPGKATETIDCTGAFLLTSFDDGTLSIESDQQSSPSQVKVVPGWIDIQETSQKISIANTGKQIIELVIIEAK